jgi:hypothetical protein
VLLHMLANVQQKMFRPIIMGVVAPGARIHTDEYDISGENCCCRARICSGPSSGWSCASNAAATSCAAAVRSAP